VVASPGVPGARPWNLSEASILAIADSLDGSIGDDESAPLDEDAKMSGKAAMK